MQTWHPDQPLMLRVHRGPDERGEVGDGLQLSPTEEAINNTQGAGGQGVSGGGLTLGTPRTTRTANPTAHNPPHPHMQLQRENTGSSLHAGNSA